MGMEKFSLHFPCFSRVIFQMIEPVWNSGYNGISADHHQEKKKITIANSINFPGLSRANLETTILKKSSWNLPWVKPNAGRRMATLEGTLLDRQKLEKNFRTPQKKENYF